MQKGKTQLTDLAIRRMRPPEDGQILVWDTVQKGLGLLIGKGGTKSFRSHYRLNGTWKSRNLGRFGELLEDETENANVAWAREQCRQDRIKARQGIDPKFVPKEDRPLTFEEVVDDFIARYAKDRQRTWAQTQNILKRNCAAWLEKPINSIGRDDAKKVLDGLVKAGKGPTATLTLAWLRTLWKWAADQDAVPDPRLMIKVSTLAYERQEKDRVYSDEELKGIWKACRQLNPIEAAFIRLLILLAPRKQALARMQWCHLDDEKEPTLWTTPFELTKSRKKAKKRVYLTPLPPFSQSILQGIPRRHDELVFPSASEPNVPLWPGSPLQRKLSKHGAPEDFAYHTARHTMATHFENSTDFEVGLLLNHAHSTVTSGYRHSYAIDLKLTMLTEWEDHVRSVVEN